MLEKHYIKSFFHRNPQQQPNLFTLSQFLYMIIICDCFAPKLWMIKILPSKMKKKKKIKSFHTMSKYYKYIYRLKTLQAPRRMRERTCLILIYSLYVCVCADKTEEEKVGAQVAYQLCVCIRTNMYKETVYLFARPACFTRIQHIKICSARLMIHR